MEDQIAFAILIMLLALSLLGNILAWDRLGELKRQINFLVDEAIIKRRNSLNA